jgi:hypothetical protein
MRSLFQWQNICWMFVWLKKSFMKRAESEISSTRLLGVLHASAWAKNILWVRSCLSVFRIIHHIIGAHCCNNANRCHCWSTKSQPIEPMSLLDHIVATKTSNIIATMTLPFIQLLHLLLLWLPCWRHHPWCGVDFSVLQRVRLSSLVFSIWKDCDECDFDTQIDLCEQILTLVALVTVLVSF